MRRFEEREEEEIVLWEYMCAQNLVTLGTLPLGLAGLQTLCSQNKLVLPGFGAVVVP